MDGSSCSYEQINMVFWYFQKVDSNFLSVFSYDNELIFETTLVG